MLMTSLQKDFSGRQVLVIRKGTKSLTVTVVMMTVIMVQETTTFWQSSKDDTCTYAPISQKQTNKQTQANNKTEHTKKPNTNKQKNGEFT